MEDPKHKTEKFRVPLLLPHELLNYLSEPYMYSLFFILFFFVLRIYLSSRCIRSKANDKIKVVETEKSKFWSHFKSFLGPYPAIDHHENNPNQSWHHPVGVSGDDARYTLAGRKLIIMMISSVLQEVKSALLKFMFWDKFKFLIVLAINLVQSE